MPFFSFLDREIVADCAAACLSYDPVAVFPPSYHAFPLLAVVQR